ncbi:MAG: hypothetical protein ACRDNO_05345 [Trebonia sp.]
MDDLNDPRISAYKPQRRLRLPAPPGYRSKLSKAQRKQKAQAEARAEARATRLHLPGLTDAAVIIMGLVAAVMVVVVLVLVLISHG